MKTSQADVLPRPAVAFDCIATVVEAVDLTPTIKSIRLALDCPTFYFLPGQSLWPKFERDGQVFSKIYSIASSPSHCPTIELCVSRVGWSSSYLHHLKVGDTLPVRGPYGLLTLNQLPDRPRLYIAEGSGIAPIKSHIEWLFENQCPHPVALVQSNPETPDCLPYGDYWRSLQQRWPQFHYWEAVHSSPETLLMGQDINLAEWDIDICGVGDRVMHLHEMMLSLGAKRDRIRHETFFAF